MGIDKKLEAMVMGRYAEYERDRGGLLSTLKRHAHAIARELGSEKFRNESLAMGAAGTVAAVGAWAVVGAAVPVAVAVAGVAVVAGGMAVGVAGLAATVAHLATRGVKANAADWSNDMNKLNDLMLKAEHRSFDNPKRAEYYDLSDPDKLRTLASYSWLDRKLSPYPKEVFAVADQMKKIEGTSYEGVMRNHYRAPTEDIRHATSTWQSMPSHYQQRALRDIDGRAPTTSRSFAI